MTITKNDLIAQIYGQMGLQRKECSAIVESLFEIIKDELAKGNDVMITGLGKWSVRAKKERRGRNPQTGEDITIEARKVVTFKPSNVLRDTIKPKA